MYKEMRKSDLKTGWRVTLRNGEQMIVVLGFSAKDDYFSKDTILQSCEN
jgi:hypothetical protein